MDTRRQARFEQGQRNHNSHFTCLELLRRNLARLKFASSAIEKLNNSNLLMQAPLQGLTRKEGNDIIAIRKYDTLWHLPLFFD
jgi:hypothetical protein